MYIYIYTYHDDDYSKIIIIKQFSAICPYHCTWDVLAYSTSVYMYFPKKKKGDTQISPSNPALFQRVSVQRAKSLISG